MTVRWFLFCATCWVWLIPASLAQNPDATVRSGEPNADFAVLLAQLGDDDYRVRENATRLLIGLGEKRTPELRKHLSIEADPEVRYRIRFVLENIAPPDEAVLVMRASIDGQLEPGDLITHINGRRVRRVTALHSRLGESDIGVMLRVRRAGSPLDIGPLQFIDLPSLADYRQPTGAVVHEALDLYVRGFAEKAYERIRDLADVSEQELSSAFRAVLAHTAGDGAAARNLLRPEMLNPPGQQQLGWTNPSGIDLAGPQKAPLHLEWLLFKAENPMQELRGSREPDLFVQRVFVPARRSIEAATQAAAIWSENYRTDLQGGSITSRLAGNMLAVIAWMMAEMDLKSECLRLSEPRSVILGFKWIRVEADAWLEFLRGDDLGALNGFWGDARAVLEFPLPPSDPKVLTRNPDIAARLAFFLYQQPDDPRVGEMLAVVNQPRFPVLEPYVHWMLFALNRANEEKIRADLSAILPNLPDHSAFPVARALALLGYIDESRDSLALASARERIAQSPSRAEREYWMAIAETLDHLHGGRGGAALRRLEEIRGPGADALRYTARFLEERPGGADAIPALASPLMAVPLGVDGAAWIILTRERTLQRFDVERRAVETLPLPAPTWLPGAVNWPWLGHDPTSGRVWVYDRRRVVELAAPGAKGLQLNIRPEQIEAFDTIVSPFFATLANRVAEWTFEPGENAEFFRAEILAHGEYVADPDLPEIGVIETLEQAPNIAHIAVRGGPQLLVDAQNGRTWDSSWIAARLNLPSAPRFFPAAVRPHSEPLLFLMSDQGLIRFEPGISELRRIPLPGDTPFSAVIPESCPYERRDPRWVYFSLPPEAGGQAYRYRLADDVVEPLDMINEMLPPAYYAILSRANLRLRVDLAFREAGLPTLEEFIADARHIVSAWRRGQP